MGYTEDDPFKNREHMVAEVRYCGNTAKYLTILSLACLALGIISDILGMKLLLGATSWFLFSLVAAVISLAPHLHKVMARHLLAMEIINKERQ